MPHPDQKGSKPMTTMMDQSYTCAVCGGKTEFPTIMSTNMFGSSDLDMRPPEMRRSTMFTWVQTCPHCGYASSTIDRPTSVTRQWLSSPEYDSLTDVTGLAPEAPLPMLAREFYMSSKCHLADGLKAAAIDDLVCAAWSCDDEGDAAAPFARRLRILAADLTEEVLSEMEGAEIEDDENGQPEVLRLSLRCIDLLRRAGEFDRAVIQCSAVKRLLSAGDYDRVLSFVAGYEQDLIDKGDTSCHTVQQAVTAEISIGELIIDEARRSIQKTVDQIVASKAKALEDEGDEGNGEE